LGVDDQGFVYVAAAAEGLTAEVGTLELAHLPRAAVEHSAAGWIRVVSARTWLG